MIRGVIFDLDGTLVDTISDIGDSLNRVLVRHGRAEHDYKAYKTFVGTGAKNLVIKALGNADEPTVIQVLREYRAEYKANILAKSRPYEGIPALLDSLKAAGLKLAVLSNKPDDDVKYMISELLPAYFDVAQGQREGVKMKPDPEAAEDVARTLGLKPDELAMVGDSGVDMRFAKNSGMFAVGVSWGFRGTEELRGDGADFIADTAEELRDELLSRADVNK